MAFELINALQKRLVWLALLIISVIIPLDNRVFNFANPAQIAMDFDYLVLMDLVVVFVVRQHGLLRRVAETRWEPLNTAQVEYALHVEVV